MVSSAILGAISSRPHETFRPHRTDDCAPLVCLARDRIHRQLPQITTHSNEKMALSFNSLNCWCRISNATDRFPSASIYLNQMQPQQWSFSVTAWRQSERVVLPEASLVRAERCGGFFQHVGSDDTFRNGMGLRERIRILRDAVSATLLDSKGRFQSI